MMIVMLLVSVAMDGMSNDLIALGLIMQQFLQSENQADDQSDLANDEGLKSEQCQGTQSDGDEGCSLQFQEKKDGQQGFNDLLFLATS